MSAALVSPLTGNTLVADTAHSLSDGIGERWPVVDGIAFLRTGRARLVRDALDRLDSGDRNGALALLLADQDDWWPGPPADANRLAALVRDAERCSLRQAMDLLGFGRVGDYLAHRWSDPTYLAGLALMEAHWSAPASAFELACGSGPYLRDLAAHGVACCGADVVFAKLWLARHWVCGPAVELVCFDAASPWPIAERRFDLILCHDALYFLEPKTAIVARLRALRTGTAVLAMAHVHNRDAANLSAGAAVTARELAELFPDGVVYDDAELTEALVEARAPQSKPWAALAAVEAFSLIEGPREPARPVVDGLAMPTAGAALVRNPLYDDDGRIAWPSSRYRDEYALRATFPSHSGAPAKAVSGPTVAGMARRRELVALPDRW